MEKAGDTSTPKYTACKSLWSKWRPRVTDNPLRDVQTLKGVVSCHEVMSNSVLNRWLSRRSDQELALRDTGDARIKSNIISPDLETQL